MDCSILHQQLYFSGVLYFLRLLTCCLSGCKVKSYPTSSTSYLLRTVLDAACPKEARMPEYENEKDYVNRKIFNVCFLVQYSKAYKLHSSLRSIFLQHYQL